MNKATGVLCPALLLVCAAVAPGQSVFPTGTTIWTMGSTDDGLTVFPTSTGIGVAIDMDGTIVNTWTSPGAGSGDILTNVEPLAGTAGHIMAINRTSTGPRGGNGDGPLYELDWNGNIIFQWAMPAGIHSMHHDHERVSNGNTYVLLSSFIDIGASEVLLDDCIAEVDPGGTVVWTWRTVDHLTEFGFTPLNANLANQALQATEGDWAHANTLSVIPANTHTDPAFAEGNIIVSQRSTNAIFIIDRSTDAVVWVSDFQNGQTQGQHHTHMIPMGFNGAGNILVYDNGSGTGYPGPLGFNRGYTRLVEIDPTDNSEPWMWRASSSPADPKFNRVFFSDIVGSVQRLSNGNTMAIEGVDGRIFEIDTNGDIVWEYVTDQVSGAPPFENRLIYRAFRMPYSWDPN